MAQSSECRLTRGAARQCGPWVLLGAMFIASVSSLLWDGVHNSVEAQIKPSAEDEIFVLQHKPFLRKNRVELAPSFSARNTIGTAGRNIRFARAPTGSTRARSYRPILRRSCRGSAERSGSRGPGYIQSVLPK